MGTAKHTRGKRLYPRTYKQGKILPRRRYGPATQNLRCLSSSKKDFVYVTFLPTRAMRSPIL